MITDVGVDLDGVVFDFATVSVKHFSDYLGRELSSPTKWKFYEDWDLTARQFYELLDTLTQDREIFNDPAPIPKSMVGWQALRDQKVRIHVLTHRSDKAWAQTVRWLERYRMIPDSLHFTGEKAAVLSNIALDEACAIDDHYDQYLSYRDHHVQAFLFDQPWNHGYPASRVKTLPEFANYIKTYNDFHSLDHTYTMQRLATPTHDYQ